ncbi:MAG TPA: hypothetical protein VMS92_01570 [Mycobacterium sp.]|nr:hypothetical protein [Mycobacterium sp.]
MVISSRIAVGTMAAAAMIATVVGCSNPGAPTSSGPETTLQSTSASVRPSATSAVPHSPPKPDLGRIDVTIAALGNTTVRPGGPPMRFAVTLVNNGPDIAAVGMVVSLGHCSCSPPGAAMMPAGSMRMLDPQTNTWVEVPYDAEGTGMDYITQNLVPPFPLTHGQTVEYQLEMALDADQDSTVKEGKGGINVTPTDPADPMRYGFRYAKFLPITVEP